VIGSKWRK